MADEVKESVQVEDGGQEQQGNPEVEAKALAMGWLPQDRFPGDPEKWTSAEEFVRRGEEFLPFIKSENRRLKHEIEELRQSVKALDNHHRAIQQREYNAMQAEITRLKAEAVTAGNGQAYAELERQQTALNAQAAPGVSQQQNSGPPPEFFEWKGRPENSWYQTDQAMTEAADTFGLGLAARHPNLSPREIYERTTEHIKQAFPHKFQPQRSAKTPVEGGGRPSANGGKGYNSLPADAKAACDRFVKQKLMTREQYVKDFFGEE